MLYQSLRRTTSPSPVKRACLRRNSEVRAVKPQSRPTWAAIKRRVTGRFEATEKNNGDPEHGVRAGESCGMDANSSAAHPATRRWPHSVFSRLAGMMRTMGHSVAVAFCRHHTQSPNHPEDNRPASRRFRHDILHHLIKISIIGNSYILLQFGVDKQCGYFNC